MEMLRVAAANAGERLDSNVEAGATQQGAVAATTTT
jgi:hypothetical protein